MTLLAQQLGSAPTAGGGDTSAQQQPGVIVIPPNQSGGGGSSISTLAAYLFIGSLVLGAIYYIYKHRKKLEAA